MKFLTALRYMASGYKIRRSIWGEDKFINHKNELFMRDLGQIDLNATDWEVVE